MSTLGARPGRLYTATRLCTFCVISCSSALSNYTAEHHMRSSGTYTSLNVLLIVYMGTGSNIATEHALYCRQLYMTWNIALSCMPVMHLVWTSLLVTAHSGPAALKIALVYLMQ